MCNDNDPQASIRHLQEQLAERDRSIKLYKEQAHDRRNQLAESRAELEVTRTELASALCEGDVLKAERDGLRDQLRKVWVTAIGMHERITKNDTLPPLRIWRETIEASQAALEPKPEPVAKEGDT